MVALASFDQSPELRLATVAHLSRYRGTSREHTESDLGVFINCCRERQLAPLSAQRHDLELYLRWLQDVRRFKPSTVSRRLSVVAGFYRTCVIDGVLEHSPADYVRRPSVPPESPTLGLTHLRFDAIFTGVEVPSCTHKEATCILRRLTPSRPSGWAGLIRAASTVLTPGSVPSSISA